MRSEPTSSVLIHLSGMIDYHGSNLLLSFTDNCILFAKASQTDQYKYELIVAVTFSYTEEYTSKLTHIYSGRKKWKADYTHFLLFCKIPLKITTVLPQQRYNKKLSFNHSIFAHNFHKVFNKTKTTQPPINLFITYMIKIIVNNYLKFQRNALRC